MNWLRSYWPKVASGLAILAVAATAATISFGHIYDLSIALHQGVLAARLFPVGIDGLVVVGSVVLLQGGRLGWVGVGPGVGISLFANAESGLRYGPLAAIWAGVPALSFFLATFILERWLQGQAKAKPESAPVSAPEPAMDEGTEPAIEPPVKRTANRTPAGQGIAAKVAALAAKSPDMTQRQMAARLKVSERTVRRHLAAVNGSNGAA